MIGWFSSLEILKRQAEINMSITDRISDLYEGMAIEFRERLRSQWALVALDYVFTRPVFRNSAFTASSKIPVQTAHRISRKLTEWGILTQVEPASGRRASLLAFQPLLEIVRT